MWVTRSSSPTCLTNFHNKLQSPPSSRTCQNKQVISGQRVLSCHLSVKGCTKETVLIFVKIVLTTRNDPWRVYFYSVGCTFLALHFLWNNAFFWWYGHQTSRNDHPNKHRRPLVQLGWSICSIKFEVLPKSMKQATHFSKASVPLKCEGSLDKHKMLLEKPLPPCTSR